MQTSSCSQIWAHTLAIEAREQCLGYSGFEAFTERFWCSASGLCWCIIEWGALCHCPRVVLSTCVAVRADSALRRGRERSRPTDRPSRIAARRLRRSAARDGGGAGGLGTQLDPLGLLHPSSAGRALLCATARCRLICSWAPCRKSGRVPPLSPVESGRGNVRRPTRGRCWLRSVAGD